MYTVSDQHGHDFKLDSLKTSVSLKMQPSHILHRLLPEQNSDVKCMATRSSGKEIYNFYCRTELFKGSPIVFAFTKYDERID